MSITICNNARCVGCGLCADVCPCGAVRIESDEYGFAHPVIDDSLCVECGSCAGACPVNREVTGEEKALFAAYAKDREIRRRSSSGGIFRLLAEKTIERGGAVAAVGYDESFRAVYKIAAKPDELDELMGSKYTEAASCGIYGKVKELLDSGGRVMFVGNPCRVAALKSYLGERDGLLAVDFLCYGVPSSLLFEKYLAETFDSVDGVSFRDKTHGWQEYSMRVDSKGKKYVCSRYKDPYLRIYLSSILLRESCFACPFKDMSYASDITLGDFWGISSCIPAMNDDGGTSAVIIRSEKGSSAFDEIRNSLIYREARMSDLRRGNLAVTKRAERSPDHEDALEMLKSGKPFSAIAEKYGHPLPARTIAYERAMRSAKKLIGKIKK